MAASIAVHLTQRGFMVRLVTADGEEPNTAWHDRTSAVNTAPLLEALAVVTLSRRPDLDTDWLIDSSPTSMLVGVRSEERREGKECVRQCRSRWSPYH